MTWSLTGYIGNLVSLAKFSHKYILKKKNQIKLNYHMSIPRVGAQPKSRSAVGHANDVEGAS